MYSKTPVNVRGAINQLKALSPISSSQHFCASILINYSLKTIKENRLSSHEMLTHLYFNLDYNVEAYWSTVMVD